MRNRLRGYIKSLNKYHFELKHVVLLFLVLALFQVVTSFMQKLSLNQFILRTGEWYQRDSAERLANLVATSLELLMETDLQAPDPTGENQAKLVRSFNIILTQQVLQKHVEMLCIFVEQDSAVRIIDSGQDLYSFMRGERFGNPPLNEHYEHGIAIFRSIKSRLLAEEQIISQFQEARTIHVFVPFFPKGEFAGALYLRISPQFGVLTKNIVRGFAETSMIFIAILLFGLLSMFYVTSYTIKERDLAQELLFKEREQKLLKEVEHKKEALFTNRIYHTHHKAEKIMGFIKEDLRTLSGENIQIVKERLHKYANFVARVIYDMKWYDPPVHTIRGPAFSTDVNQLLSFLIDNVFNRVADNRQYCAFHRDLDGNMPRLSVNEFVVWEILEPLLQNSIDHATRDDVEVWISTKYDAESRQGTISIRDNGPGIKPELLVRTDSVQKIFQENVSTKNDAINSGYGCFIAHEIAKNRCGWDILARNIEQGGGCEFIITIPNL